MRAFSILVLRSILAPLDSSIEPRLYGGKGSIAAALDGVLSKEPMWLLDAFGVFPNGSPVHRRLFARSNPGRKRLGPVAVSLAPRIKSSEIFIYLDGIECSTLQEFQKLLRELELIEQPTSEFCTES